jgi:hypothetical protein
MDNLGKSLTLLNEVTAKIAKRYKDIQNIQKH